MLQFRQMLSGSGNIKLLCRLGGIALLLSCLLAVFAQSGRRARRTDPVPVPTPEATPTPNTPAAPAKPVLTFVVGLERDGFSRISLNAYGGVLDNLTGRLAAASGVRADSLGRDLTRAEAIAKAKAEKEAYVVWLQLRPDTMGGSSGVYDDPNNVYLSYSVFAPGTAKLATSGNTYPDSYRNKRVRLPTPTGSGDYYLNQAARGAAERILDHFHKGGPTGLP